MELHVLKVILRREQTIITQDFRSISNDYSMELRRSVTYKADYQPSKQVIVAQIRDQVGYLPLCWHLY
jgi:hypothetical protein